MTSKTKRAAVLGAGMLAMAAGAAATGGARADSIRIAHGYPAQSIIGATYEHFAKYVEDHSDIEADVFALTLLDLRQASPGLTSGVADVAMVLTPYFQNEFSESNFPADLSMAANLGGRPTSIAATLAGAMMEYIALDCPDCQMQIQAQGQVYLATAPGTQFSMLCREPMVSKADVEGRTLRAATNTFRRWAEAMGATASSISGNEIYDGLSQGLIDCTINAVGEMSNFSLFDVVKGITLAAPGGTFGGSGIGHFNMGYWADLDVETRRMMARGMADTAAFMSTQYVKQAQTDLAKAREMGIQVSEPDASLAEATAAFASADVQTVIQLYSEQYGVPDAEAKAARFQELLAKWKGLTDPLDPADQAALSELLWTEVLSKLDYETYGLQ
ncbi:MAG: hypothetical protein VYD87_13045 [Pseudomonadota bacterium]|nr:hypothetical protein [Pseudomonadota bacterium]MEE3099084.1 hypothetical protein [Pseudomonadota bacterium]